MGQNLLKIILVAPVDLSYMSAREVCSLDMTDAVLGFHSLLCA